jgi:hypothetical protein
VRLEGALVVAVPSRRRSTTSTTWDSPQKGSLGHIFFVAQEKNGGTTNSLILQHAFSVSILDSFLKSILLSSSFVIRQKRCLYFKITKNIMILFFESPNHGAGRVRGCVERNDRALCTMQRNATKCTLFGMKISSGSEKRAQCCRVN